MNNFFTTLEYSNSKRFLTKLKDTVRGYKVVHLHRIPQRLEPLLFYTELVDSIGAAVNIEENILTGNLTGERWTEVKYIRDKDYTFRHSNTRQPLHTDAAYSNTEFDVNILVTIKRAEIGGATVFIDGAYLNKILKKYRPGLFEKLIANEVIFHKGDEGIKMRKVVELLQHNEYRLNWNYYRVSDENQGHIKELCDDFHNTLENYIVSAGLLTQVTLQKGECLLFQDSQVLHGRNSFYGDRHLIKGAFNLI